MLFVMIEPGILQIIQEYVLSRRILYLSGRYKWSFVREAERWRSNEGLRM